MREEERREEEGKGKTEREGREAEGQGARGKREEVGKGCRAFWRILEAPSPLSAFCHHPVRS